MAKLITEEWPDLGPYDVRKYRFGFELDGYVFWSGKEYGTKQQAAMQGGKLLKKWFPPEAEE